MANRGVAVADGLVYVGALDGMLYALDARTGQVVWKVDSIEDHSRGMSSTGAPEIAGDMVVLGNAGEALGDSLYEARLFVRGSVQSLGADCIEKDMRPEHIEILTRLLAEAGVEGVSPQEFRRYGSARGLNAQMDNSKIPQTLPRFSATFDPHTLAEIRRAAATGIYDIRGGGTKRALPHFDDLLFLGAS
eukprot:gene17366-21939_t